VKKQVTDIFDEEGNAKVHIPDVKKFNLVFDNSEYKLDQSKR